MHAPMIRLRGALARAVATAALGPAISAVAAAALPVSQVAVPSPAPATAAAAPAPSSSTPAAPESAPAAASSAAAQPGASAPGAPAKDPAAERGRAIIAGLLRTHSTWERLRPLTDTIGARIAGSEAGARAVAWAKGEFEREGLTVRLEPVMEPVWVRGQERAEILAPSRLPLPILGLGRSVGTPPGGITAPVAVVGSYEELTALGRGKVEGKIVLYDKAFPRDVSPMEGYGAVVKFRGGGASAAARLGAVAALVRSAATASLRTPHTGVMRYAEDAPKIPAAGVSIEDAMLIRRLTEAGHEVRVRLEMGARTEPDREGANVVAELPGPGEAGGDRPDRRPPRLLGRGVRGDRRRRGVRHRPRNHEGARPGRAPTPDGPCRPLRGRGIGARGRGRLPRRPPGRARPPCRGARSGRGRGARPRHRRPGREGGGGRPG